MHAGYLIVPKNRQGMIDQMMQQENDENLLFIRFSSAQIEALRPLLAEYERAFGFDSCGQTVEQLIDTRCAGLALELAEARARHAAGDEREAARKMTQALQAALGFGSYVEFAF